MYEKLIRNYVEKSLNSTTGLSNFKFSFRRKRSSVDAIKMVTNIALEAVEEKRWMEGNKKCYLVITLDIKSDFNLANR